MIVLDAVVQNAHDHPLAGISSFPRADYMHVEFGQVFRSSSVVLQTIDEIGNNGIFLPAAIASATADR